MSRDTAPGSARPRNPGLLRRLWPSTIRAQLVLGVALLHFLLVSAFVVDQVGRQRRFLTTQSLEQTAGLARTLALNSGSWVLANDVVGLGELVRALQARPFLHYAMVVAPDGQVLAHTDPARVGRFLTDERSLAMLHGEARVDTIHVDDTLLDVAAPVFSSTSACIAWVRIGQGQEDIARNLDAVTRNGILYAVVAGLLGAAFGAVMGRRLTSKLGQLLAVSAQVRDGRADLRIPTSSGDEIARLGEGFNQMLDAIQERERENARLEAQLLHAQKLESVGRLAGGVAHDFNNLLTAIIGNAQLMADDLPDEHPMRAGIDEILVAAGRAADVTRGLLAFSRKQRISPVPVDLNDVVREIDRLLARIIGEGIKVAIRLSPRELVVTVDRAQMEQVLMNLSTNARDAMPSGGTFRIETADATLDAGFVETHGGGAPGRYAVLTVSDSGVGMDAETRERIFDPFFTTKESGKGTGLGLAMVYGVVGQHGGFVDVASEPGRGTTFRIFLPLSPLRPPGDVAAPAPPRVPHLPGGSETILLAEDDELLRSLASRLLRRAGYRVLVAQDGDEALELFAGDREGIELCLLDLGMPRRSGRAAYEEIRKRRPDMRFLFVSGYSTDEKLQGGLPEPGTHFLQKPYQNAVLLQRVRDILDGREVAQT